MGVFWILAPHGSKGRSKVKRSLGWWDATWSRHGTVNSALTGNPSIAVSSSVLASFCQTHDNKTSFTSRLSGPRTRSLDDCDFAAKAHYWTILITSPALGPKEGIRISNMNAAATPSLLYLWGSAPPLQLRWLLKCFSGLFGHLWEH